MKNVSLLLREFAARSLHPLVIYMKVSNCITLLDSFTPKHCSSEAIFAYESRRVRGLRTCGVGSRIQRKMNPNRRLPRCMACNLIDLRILMEGP